MTKRRHPRESSLARLKRERPEMFSGHYFSEPVRKWFPWFVSSDWCSKGFVGSQAATAAREEALSSNDAQRRWAAIGNLGELRKVRK